MFKKITFSILTSVILFLFLGCSKDIEEYNKPAVYWYGKIVESISDNNLDMADDYFTSLQGEHTGSPLLPEATLILAMAHLHEEEYLLSEYFFDEYVKRFANLSEKEFAQYMKIKAKYKALPNVRRDQMLIQSTLEDCQKFKRVYPNSIYFYAVDTIATNLYMAEASLNKMISDLYVRIDKPRSAKYYEQKNPQPWIEYKDVQKENIPWYSRWFVGDGSASWYGFLIPDTRSVVSRNSVLYDENTTNEKVN